MPVHYSANPKAGTRVGKGRELHSGIDGRTQTARRYKEVLGQLSRQLVVANNGLPPSPMQMILVRRAATLAVWCEGAEADMARGATIEINEYNNSTNTLRRTLADVGLVFQ